LLVSIDIAGADAYCLGISALLRLKVA